MRRVVAPVLAFAVAGWLGACSVPPERSILEEFFAAARLRDTTALKELATTSFEPLERGIVTDFEVQQVMISGESRKIVTIEALVHQPDGEKVRQRLVVTLEQGIRTGTPDATRRWIVTKVEAAGR